MNTQCMSDGHRKGMGSHASKVKKSRTTRPARLLPCQDACFREQNCFRRLLQLRAISLVAAWCGSEAHRQQNKRIPHVQSITNVFAHFLPVVPRRLFYPPSWQHKENVRIDPFLDGTNSSITSDQISEIAGREPARLGQAGAAKSLPAMRKTRPCRPAKTTIKRLMIEYSYRLCLCRTERISGLFRDHENALEPSPLPRHQVSGTRQASAQRQAGSHSGIRCSIGHTDCAEDAWPGVPKQPTQEDVRRGLCDLTFGV